MIDESKVSSWSLSQCAGIVLVKNEKSERVVERTEDK
jgi:hypothetical protein